MGKWVRTVRLPLVWSMSVHSDWQWDCKVTDNTLSASVSGAALEPPVQTRYLCHLVCTTKSSAGVIIWYHYCIGTASWCIIDRVTYLHVQKHVKACLEFAVNNMICWWLTNKPWPLSLLGSSVISHTLGFWNRLAVKGRSICCVSAVREVLCERVSTLKGLEQIHRATAGLT